MKLWPLFWLAIVMLTLAAPLPATAFVAQSGNAVLVSAPIRDDLYAAGRTVTVMAPVEGDVSAAKRSIEIQPGAQVTGGTVRLPIPSRPRTAVAPASPRFWLGGHVAEFLARFALDLISVERRDRKGG